MRVHPIVLAACSRSLTALRSARPRHMACMLVAAALFIPVWNVLVARLDNLGKGASGAAVQNLNIMLGLGEDLGLQL